MKVRTDLRAGQAPSFDPEQLAQWAQQQMQSPGGSSALAPVAGRLLQLAQGPLDAQALASAVQTAAGPLHPQQFLALVGSMQGFLGKAN